MPAGWEVACKGSLPEERGSDIDHYVKAVGTISEHHSPLMTLRKVGNNCSGTEVTTCVPYHRFRGVRWGGSVFHDCPSQAVPSSVNAPFGYFFGGDRSAITQRELYGTTTSLLFRLSRTDAAAARGANRDTTVSEPIHGLSQAARPTAQVYRTGLRLTKRITL